jgi:purine-binding chemotaxis protein CheW
MNKTLFFEINNYILGIKLNEINEVLENKNIQPIPLAPPFVVGVLPRRGKFLTIINLLAHPLKDISPDARILVLEHKEIDIGILVSKIRQVISTPITLPANQNTGFPLIHNDEKKCLCHHLIRMEEGIPFLDLEKLFTYLKKVWF